MTAAGASNIKIIMIFPYSLTAFDAVKFGFDALLASGVDLRIFDLSPLISARSDTGAKFLNADYIKKIPSYALLEQEILTQGKAIYIDNINGVNGFQWQGRGVYQLFKKYNVEYYVVEVGALPIFAPLTAKSFLNKIKNAFNFQRLSHYLKWRLGKLTVYYQWKWLQAYQLPAKIFIGNSESRERYLEKFQLKASQVVSIHSFDYDRYLNYIRSAPTPLFPGKRICVFLDQMLATHCDFGKSVSFNPVTAQNYIPTLNNFFDLIEEELQLKVVIAASPRADYVSNPIFGTRPVVSGKSLELVAESVLVLFHSTTAISFATLFDKPILMIKTKEMTHALGYANFLNNMAASLNLKPLCIDDQEEINSFNFSAFAAWPRHYDNYKYKYVMSKNTHDQTTWEILLATITSQKKELAYV
jgi:hypothetical protein